MEESQVRKRVALLVMALMLSSCAAAESLSIHAPDTVHPFGTAQITVEVPLPGTLTVRVADGYGEQQPVVRQLAVTPGTVTLDYDGLSYCGMPLMSGSATLTAQLQTVEGSCLESSSSMRIGDAEPVLEYALPRSETYYLEQHGSWMVDCGVSGKSEICLSIYADAERTEHVVSVRKTIANQGIFSIPWKGETGDGRVAAGIYWCSVYRKGQEERAFVFPLYVEEGAPPEENIYLTGSLLPQSDDPDELLEKFYAPLVVIDIEATDHQEIYKEPSTKSEVLGTVHGQSQGLEVLEQGKQFTLVGAWRHEDGAYIQGYVPNSLLMVVRPFEHYGVIIDKPRQELRVYEYGTLVGKMRVSTGLMAEDKLFRETRAGAFITTDRMIAFDSNGFTYRYPIRIDGGNLIHQMGYKPAAKGGFAQQLGDLGWKASEGCVRMDYRTDEEYTLNAYWIWTHLERGTKVLVLDDPDAREARLEALTR